MKRLLRPTILGVTVLFSLVPVSILGEQPIVQQYREQSVWRGRANPKLEMKSMMFAFQLQNPQDLERLLQEQQDPGSPNYHRWLTPEEFGNRFGVSQEEYQRAVQWLEQNGFSVKMPLGNRLRIYFDGVAEDAERAFGVNIELYEYKGKTYFANDLPPQIPAEFQEHGLGIYGLDNFPKEYPLFQRGNTVALAPTDAHVAYNLFPLLQAGIDGIGQSIAIVARSDFNLSDVQSFRSTFGLPPNDPMKIFVGNNPGNLGDGEEDEVLLDTEWAGAIAKGATVQVVISDTKNIQTSIDYILNRLFTTRVMTISFGLGETALDNQTVQAFSSFFSQAAAQGQTVVVSSGDQGAQQSIGNNKLSTGPDINHLCSSPYVVCVGGTSLNVQFDASGNVTQYLNETAWNKSGGGKSKFIQKPSYQIGPGVPPDGQRDVPDVAVMGDPGGPGAFIFARGSIPRFTVGGTSLSAPIWAGVFALVNQYGSPGGVGWANPRLYQLGQAQQSQGGPQVFNDVTVGNNNTLTVTGFSAGPGFDLVTGWGSFNGNVFVRNFTLQPNPPTIVPIDSNPSITGTIPPSSSTTGCALNPTQYTINVPSGALQLVVILDGSPSGDVDLYVRKGQPVGDTGSFNPFISDYRSEGSTAHEAVYLGPNSTIPLTQGTYYIAVSNCKSTPGPFTLTANVVTGSSPTKGEELFTDNGIVEASFPQNQANGAIVVNRLRPSRYPSKLTKVRIYSTHWNGPPDIDPAGQKIRILAFGDPGSTGNPPSPASPLVVDQMVTVPGSNGFMEFAITNPPVIQSGDWYVGFQHPATYSGVLASMNLSGVPQQAGFVSTDNAVSFTGPYQQPNNVPPPSQIPANFIIRAVVESHVNTSSTVNLNVPPMGAAVSSTNMANTAVQAGYATASAGSGNLPLGTAVFSFSQGGIVVTEAGVPASGTTNHARLFIDYRSAVSAKSSSSDAGTIDINTGFAVVNASGSAAHLNFTLRDFSGNPVGSPGNGTLNPNEHRALFINQLDQFANGFRLPPNFAAALQFGTLDVQSDQPISILALRQTTNQRLEALFTTTPVADIQNNPASSGLLYFPQLVDGGGYQTTLLFLNTGSAVEVGKILVYDKNGNKLPVNFSCVGGTYTSSNGQYNIPVNGILRCISDGTPSTVNVGWVVVTPNPSTTTPVGAGVFSYSSGGVLVTESGIPAATPTTHARIYVDMTNGHRTGLAIGNVGNAQQQVILAAFQPDGITPAPTPGSNTTTLQISGNGKDAKFADEFVSGLPPNFTGVLDISSSSPFAAVTLRLLTNKRGDSLITTFPIVDFNQPVLGNLLYFPQIADSGGFQTQIILLSPKSAPSNVTVNYFDDHGQALALKSGKGED